MTTSVLDRVPLDAITVRARERHPGKVLLTAFLGVFMLAGWVTAKLFMVFWSAAVLTWDATATGWEKAHGPSRGRQLAVLAARVEHLAAENRRLGGTG